MIKSIDKFMILGLLKSILDYMLAANFSTYFLHSAAVWIGDFAVLFWGTRAVGKTTITRIFRNKGFRVIHDERIGLKNNSVDIEIYNGYVVPTDKLTLMLVPNIIPYGELKVEQINPRSFLYELFHELSVSIRALDVYQETLAVQSFDTLTLSQKRLQWCKDLVNQMRDSIFFIEGTTLDIYLWIINYCCYLGKK